MKIVELEVIPLTGATVDGGWPQGHEPQENLHTLVQIRTDQGIYGWGSCFTSGTLVEGAVALLWPLLKGQSAVEPERVSELLRQSSVVARGFKAIKMGWRPFGRRNRKFDELLIQTARNTVGPEVELMVDAGGSEQFWPHGTNWARATATMLADYDITWFEEPLPPDDIEGYIELTRVSPVPIAGGEVLTRRQSFLPWLERRAVDIIQPDCTKNGGLSESRRLAWLAFDHNVTVVPHGWNTAVGLAADLQFSAAIPVARYVEYLTPCAYIEELPTEPFKIDAEGYLEIPTTPGLGIDIDPEKLKKFAGKRTTFR